MALKNPHSDHFPEVQQEKPCYPYLRPGRRHTGCLETEVDQTTFKAGETLNSQVVYFGSYNTLSSENGTEPGAQARRIPRYH